MLRYTTIVFAFCASPAFAVDPCLVGNWEADGRDMAQVMAGQMGGSVSHTGGRASLQIATSGTMTMRAEGMTFSVQVPNVPPIDVTVTGHARGTLRADDGAGYVATAPDYALVGSAVVLGERMEIPVSSASGSWGTSQGSYNCTDAGLTFAPSQPGSIPPSWRRTR